MMIAVKLFKYLPMSTTQKISLGFSDWKISMYKIINLL